MDRKTIEATSVSPELLAFTADEATLGVRAISYYVGTSLHSLEANWDTQGLFATWKNVEDAAESIDKTAQFVSFYQGLAMKLSSTVEQSDIPVELSTEEIMGLGNALYNLGRSGVMCARRALHSGDIGFNSSSDRAIAAGRVEETAKDAFNLFAKLEPIAKSKEHYTWMVWEAPL